MTAYERSIDRALELVELADVYVDDGALATAANLLRKAADKLDEAVELKDRALKGLGL